MQTEPNTSSNCYKQATINLVMTFYPVISWTIWSNPICTDHS